jgi:hypothetical protein
MGSLPIMEISAPEDKASMNALVPDLAIVPRLLTKSALVIPTPVSRIVRVPSSLLGVILTNNSFSVSRAEESVKAWYRILSRASEELEINSRRKISLLE